MRGVEPLAPPSPEIAKLYLEEVQAVRERREDRIDRRAGAWRSIVGAVQLALLFTAYVLAVRADGAAFQPILVLILLSGQINAGFAERRGVQWRIRGRQWVLVAVFAVALAISFVLIVIDPIAQPTWMLFIPGALIFLAGGASGFVQLWKTRNAPDGKLRRREPMPVATRYATAALGGVLGICAISIGLPDGLIPSTVMAAVTIVVAVWSFAWMTDFGPQAFGRYWTLVQEGAFGFATAVVIVLSLLQALTETVSPQLGLAAGILVVLVLAAAAVFGSRRPRREGDR